ncbi:hypothetical protein GOHSU_18_00990 [Gordonia hirsuta DSM 44140 = NBRC 16056]|uniref:Endolytic murein transglycosylase n=1 Tax=Gordonia hirsuta DSM 44140 = NBRC 16056 TaxID=1121927 RepID=L7L8T4_9ACTN|nr:endolytic transglycosylase MltG [Gordonia hirsuta]GAC57344.1 hypothetical protein GOHSU_18_00990 [Gordonia hirsuta DSM 44140 = NBRC 16056]
MSESRTPGTPGEEPGADDRGVDEPRARHRRRRQPADPTTTGSIPIVRSGPDYSVPGIEYRHPERVESEYLVVRYRDQPPPAAVYREAGAYTEPSGRARPSVPEPSAGEPSAGSATRPTRTSRRQAERQASYAPSTATTPLRTPAATPPLAAAVPPAPAPPPAPSPPPAPGVPDTRSSSSIDETVVHSPADVTPTDVVRIADTPAADDTDSATVPLGSFDILDETTPSDSRGIRGSAEAPPPTEIQPAVDGGMPVRKRGRKALIAVVAILLVLALAAVLASWKLGAFESRKNFDSATGDGSSALVQIPENASLREFGRILAEAGVVGSQRAFVDAAGGQPMSGGFYKLPTGISGKAAVEMISDDAAAHRVGWMVIPEGTQLDSKKGADGKTTLGIFELLADVTDFDAGGHQYGVSVEELMEAAAHSSTDDLGVPRWARPAVERLNGDHRRIEGLIASGSWEDVDPRQDATQMLRSLITKSAARFDAWGLHSGNNSGLMEYDTLVVASIVEREVSREEDYPKVARVILNRLDVSQRLEMDSTINYTADVTDIDVKGEVYTRKTEWNTYQKDGLPVTPIGAVGERALQAVENPAPGDWLYFVTVDKSGRTLFTKSFEQHKKNRQIACRNKFVTTGC